VVRGAGGRWSICVRNGQEKRLEGVGGADGERKARCGVVGMGVLPDLTGAPELFPPSPVQAAWGNCAKKGPLYHGPGTLSH
jgi:hypothetical protein